MFRFTYRYSNEDQILEVYRFAIINKHVPLFFNFYGDELVLIKGEYLNPQLFSKEYFRLLWYCLCRRMVQKDYKKD